MNTNIKNLEAARDYLDKLIDDADKFIEQLDEQIVENERLIEDCIKARKLLNLLEAKGGNENA